MPKAFCPECECMRNDLHGNRYFHGPCPRCKTQLIDPDVAFTVIFQELRKVKLPFRFDQFKEKLKAIK